MANRIGQRLGNYQLTRLLGMGGFAEVYLGQHIHLNTQVAIKVLRTQVTQDEMQSFVHEAQTIVTLRNPHIIQVLDFGVDEQLPFLVMDFAPHGSLRQVHPKGSKLPLEECVSYIQQTASALQYAHDHKVIHRDIKPENMLVGSNHDILISDFGIAIVTQSSRYQGKQEVGGTVAYMAPEQLMGKAVAASDQYALAIVLYEWLCGHPPFTGSFTEICSQHVLAPPASLCEKLPMLPQSIETVVFKALMKDPQQRYSSISQFSEALERAFQESQRADGQFTQPNQSSFPTHIVTPPLPPPPAVKRPEYSFNNSQTPQAHNTSGTTYSGIQDTFSAPSIHPTEKFHQPTFVPPVKQQRNNKGYIIAITALVLALIILITWGSVVLNAQKSGAITASTLGSNQPGHSNIPASTATPTPLPTPTPTATPLPTDTPTPTPQTIQSNRLLSCSPDFYRSVCAESITIKTFVVDQGNNKLTMNFTVKNTDSSNHAILFTIYFQDAAGKSYDASGQVTSGSAFPTWPINSGASLTLAADFAFVPQQGTLYTLHITAAATDNALSDTFVNQITF